MEPSVKFSFEEDKAIASLLYICRSMGGKCDKYALLKILYFAEQKHLAMYGRPVTGDSFVAMPYGPVPSISYDLIKPTVSHTRFFDIKDNTIHYKEEPDLDCLSDSDIECLTESIEENKDLDFGALKAKSHDTAYNWALKHLGTNSVIPYLNIAQAAGANPEMIEYIKLISENENCKLNVSE